MLLFFFSKHFQSCSKSLDQAYRFIKIRSGSNWPKSSFCLRKTGERFTLTFLIVVHHFCRCEWNNAFAFWYFIVTKAAFLWPNYGIGVSQHSQCKKMEFHCPSVWRWRWIWREHIILLKNTIQWPWPVLEKHW